MAHSTSFRPIWHILPLALALPLTAPAVLGQGEVERLEAHVAERLEPTGFSGAILVRRGDESLLRMGLGLADREEQLANTPKTVFRIGSISKQFTAALVMTFVEEGALDLDALAGEYWIDCPPTWSEVTLRHLLQHTSGVPSVTDRDDYLELCLKPLRPAESLALVVDLPLQFQPGSQWRYSNSGYLMLALICETVGEKRFEALLDERVLEPLGLTRSGSEARSGRPEGLAIGYGQGADGQIQPGPPVDMNFPAGGGGMHSTVDDLARWMFAIQEGELLRESSWDAMLTPGLETYGFGIMVSAIGGEPLAHHGGSINGYVSWAGLFPGQNLVVVVLSNLASESNEGLNPQRVGMELAGLLLDPTIAGSGR